MDSKALACAVIRQIAELYATWQTNGMQVILKEWRSYCDMEGQSLRIETVKDVITGTYVEIGSVANSLCGKQMVNSCKFMLVMLKF